MYQGEIEDEHHYSFLVFLVHLLLTTPKFLAFLLRFNNLDNFNSNILQ